MSTFPYHRCSDYASSSLPYELTVPVEKEPGLYCMTISFKGPVANPSTCYNVLSTQGATRLIIGVRESTIVSLCFAHVTCASPCHISLLAHVHSPSHELS